MDSEELISPPRQTMYMCISEPKTHQVTSSLSQAVTAAKAAEASVKNAPTQATSGQPSLTLLVILTRIFCSDFFFNNYCQVVLGHFYFELVTVS